MTNFLRRRRRPDGELPKENAMIGKRTFPVHNPGEYGRIPEEKRAVLLSSEIWERQRQWQVTAPDGSQCSLNPDIHLVEEHDDGTITVSPSIVTRTWHGWLTRGVWRSV